MTALSEPTVMPDNDDQRSVSTLTNCSACELDFTPKRSNQLYCSRGCQMNASRGNRSAANRERTRNHYERAARLKQMVYSAPPYERLGVMKDILEAIPHDAGLRNILTDPELLREPPRPDNRMNVAKAAHAYVRKFFGLSMRPYIKAVMAGEEPEGIPLHPQHATQVCSAKTLKVPADVWPKPKSMHDIPTPHPGWFSRKYTPRVLFGSAVLGWPDLSDLAA